MVGRLHSVAHLSIWLLKLSPEKATARQSTGGGANYTPPFPQDPLPYPSRPSKHTICIHLLLLSLSFDLRKARMPYQDSFKSIQRYYSEMLLWPGRKILLKVSSWFPTQYGCDSLWDAGWEIALLCWSYCSAVQAHCGWGVWWASWHGPHSQSKLTLLEMLCISDSAVPLKNSAAEVERYLKRSRPNLLHGHLSKKSTLNPTLHTPIWLKILDLHANLTCFANSDFSLSKWLPT